MTLFPTRSEIETAAHTVGISRFALNPLLSSVVLKSIIKVPEESDITADTKAEAIPDFPAVTLLLAKDVKINREIFTSLLEDTWIIIETAKNGLEKAILCCFYSKVPICNLSNYGKIN